MRDKIMYGVGTSEPWILETLEQKWAAISPHWRRPLSLDEVAQMGQTAAVKARPGRP